MKFGKQLQKRQLDIPEYGASFVNYKALKKLIKQLSATPVLSAQNATQVLDPQATLQANRATFFFRLERELEKVNACYLQKEADLRLRLKTLLDKKKAAESKSRTSSKFSASFVSLEEGFQSFGNDLNKLQQFVEINATAFSKILKKWDKTSKSRTKELYLSRAVEVQPCFNREIISELSDQATTSLLELGAWAEGEKIDFTSGKASDHVLRGQVVGTEDSDTDTQLQQATSSGNLAILRDWTQRLTQAPDASQRLTRAFLSGVSEAPLESIELLLATGLVDIHAEDGINERNCLHEAAIAGQDAILRLGLDQGVNCARIDVYGRLPLHYACMYGHVSMAQQLIEADPSTLNDHDHDSYTPLIHSIVRHQLECVHLLLAGGARIDPASENEHAPLNLACQHGGIETCKLLLERGAVLTTDAEGLYPQHLVARKGKDPQLLLLLEAYGADLNQRDKLYQWTPLFHAASEGVVECVKILLEKGADATILDEKDLSAAYYAAWEGHLECMRLLSQATPEGSRTRTAPTTQQALSAQSQLISPNIHRELARSSEAQADGIPDLSLPPPIIPFRRYGHNFLDSKTFIQLTFDEQGTEAIKFFNDSKYPAARLTVSSKASDYIPRNVMIPIQEEFRVVTFQVDNPDTFAIDFDIYPSFGSKVIARTVALPNILLGNSDRCTLPLFDPRLRAIGRLSFTFQIIRPFQGTPLEISQFETYWKATSQLDTSPSTLITGSSLSGEYVQLFVQVTRDGVPVLYPEWAILHHGIRCAISAMTYAEFASFVEPSALHALSDASLSNKHRLLAHSFVTLQQALDNLDPGIKVMLQIMYPTSGTGSSDEGISEVPRPAHSINQFVDAILTVVFDHARLLRGRATPAESARAIAFSSFHAGVCIALNWKQPNYPVLLCNDLDAQVRTQSPATATSIRHEIGHAAHIHGSTAIASSGHQSISVKEAVRIARSNNLMGLVCTSTLLRMVPALIQSVKVAGLVLVADCAADTADGAGSVGGNAGAAADIGRAHFEERSGGDAGSLLSLPEGIDGYLRKDGILRFFEMIDML